MLQKVIFLHDIHVPGTVDLLNSRIGSHEPLLHFIKAKTSSVSARISIFTRGLPLVICRQPSLNRHTEKWSETWLKIEINTQQGFPQPWTKAGRAQRPEWICTTLLQVSGKAKETWKVLVIDVWHFPLLRRSTTILKRGEAPTTTMIETSRTNRTDEIHIHVIYMYMYIYITYTCIHYM